MEYVRRILLLFLLTKCPQDATGQVLSDETLFQHISCYGANADFSIVNANCSADKVIAVSRVQAGAKLNNSSCPIVLDEMTNVDFENCCKIAEDDCLVNLSTTAWHAMCSGKEYCKPASAISVPSNCTSIFSSNTSNMELDYYCINNTRIGSTCTQVNMSTSGNALYLWNAGYSDGLNTYRDCICSIEVESCSAYIEVTAIHIDLQEENETCTQNITFSTSYGDPEMVINCSEEYDITSLFTSTTNYLYVKFISTRIITLGKYWIRFRATETESNLQISCNPDVQQMFCTTSTTTAVAAPTTTTSTSDTTATSTTDTNTITAMVTPNTTIFKTANTTTSSTVTTTTFATATTAASSADTKKTTTDTVTTNDMATPITTTSTTTNTTILQTSTRGLSTAITTKSASTNTASITARTKTHTTTRQENSTTARKNDKGTQNSPESIPIIPLLVPVVIIIGCLLPGIRPVKRGRRKGPNKPKQKDKQGHDQQDDPTTDELKRLTLEPVLMSNRRSPPRFICSYCGSWEKHMQLMKSSSRKHS